MQERKTRWWQELTRYQWTVLIVAWLGWVSDVFDTSLFFLVKGDIVKEFLGPKAYDPGGPGPSVEGVMMTVFVLGWAIGGLVFGVLADRWGRKRTMMLTILLYCFFTGVTFFCESWQQVAVLRFLTALGIGGEWAAGTALIAESLPDRTRAAAAGFLQSAAAIGPVLASLTLFALAEHSWRWLFVVGIAPALIVVWVRMGIREPERWLKTERPKARAWYRDVVELFSDPRLRRNTLIALTIGVVAITAASNMSYWLPNLVTELSKGMGDVVIKQRKGFAQMIMHIGTIAGVIVFPILCERLGRKKSLAWFFAVCPFVVAGTAWTLSDYTLLVVLAPVMSFFVLGLTAGLPLYFPELFPTRLRGTGLGVCYNTGRILQAPWPLITGFLGGKLGIGVAVGLTSLVSFIGAAVMPFAQETKGQALPD
jgi:MFS family permease